MRGSLHARVAVSLFVLTVLVSAVPVFAAPPSVPSGFSVASIASINTSIDELNDIEVGEGVFGSYVYYLASPTTDQPGILYRVDPSGGSGQQFASGMPAEGVMTYGFGGDLFVAGHNSIKRVHYDGAAVTVSDFMSAGQGQSFEIEGIAFDGVSLYASVFQSSYLQANGIYKLDSLGQATLWTSGGSSIRGLAFGPGGAFGTGLYTINEYTSGTIDVIDQNGQWSQFADGWSPGWAEFFAFSDPSSSFGFYMYLAVQGSGVWRMSPSKQASSFAGGIGFSTNGVTGIRFSNDGETLYVGDDNAGIVYAIHNIEPFQGTCAVDGLSTDKTYYYLGETVEVALCYPPPERCTQDVVTYDVIVLHEGSQVAELDTFQGSSTVGCWNPKDYKYTPTDDGPYTVQFVRENLQAPLVISEVQFQVGYGNANGAPVGGVIAPVEKLIVLAPYLVLVGLIGTVALAVARKKLSF